MEGRRVAVIIASWNRSADLRLSLEAVLGQTTRPDEVVVVDNGSTDDAAAVAESFAGVKVIRNGTNLGFAEANEIGLRALGEGTDYVALVNNDALLAPDWIERMVAFLEARPEAAAAGGKQFFWGDDAPAFDRRNPWYAFTTIDCDAGLTQAQRDASDDPREVATLSGAAVMIRRRAIDDVGVPFLDPIFFAYYEETDFFSRAVRKGWRLWYVGEPACWHRVRASTAHEPYRYLYFMHRNRVIWAHRNFDDAALGRVMAEARRASRRNLLRRTDEARARRDAWSWITEHRALLAEHRARFYGNGPSFLERAREVQARASYHGHERPEVCALVPASAKNVIDFGCAAGGLGRTLKAARPGIVVRGVEPSVEPAARARAVLDDVMVGSVEDPLPGEWPQPDCVIFADVLEHLVDPWSAVRRARALLPAHGTMVVSIPNVLHHSVVRDMIAGRFDYREAGVLDRTHLRFFTAQTAIEMIQEAGFRIEQFERVIDAPPRLPAKISSLAANTRPNGRRTLRSLVADVCTVQFLIVARCT